MRVLGVDPGVSKIGLAVVVDDRVSSFRLGTAPRLKAFNKSLNAAIEYAYYEFEEYILEEEPDLVALEIVPAFGKMSYREQIVAVATTMKILCLKNNIPYVEFTPRSWHKKLCGVSAVTKDEVKEFVCRKYDLVPDMPYDVYDAIAIATVGRKESL